MKLQRAPTQLVCPQCQFSIWREVYTDHRYEFVCPKCGIVGNFTVDPMTEQEVTSIRRWLEREAPLFDLNAGPPAPIGDESPPPLDCA